MEAWAELERRPIVGEIIDFEKIPKRCCCNCRWDAGDGSGACTRPGGYDFDWKRYRCHSFQWKGNEADQRNGGAK